MTISRKKKKSPGGFSLIEVLIAVGVLGIVFMSTISIFIYGFNAVARTRQVALATQICREQIEIVRNLPYDSFVSLGSTFTHSRLSSFSAGAGAQAIEPGPGTDIKKLTVTVTWTYRGLGRRKDVTTYITRSGIDKK
jgi:prepilin-type N-terminal cleavage/methylation domain-containing protein